ncbi:MAG: hypothetical protein M3Q27_05645 [Actinomycetota bacterium]|nr:hypothetical protein [Actinomycetota bacterium]
MAFRREPDLKDGRGGLRDVTVLRAIAVSWVADRPHGAVDAATQTLLDVRDGLHLSTAMTSRRARDVLVAQEQDAVAARLGLAEPESVLRRTAQAGRVIAYATEPDLARRAARRTSSSPGPPAAANTPAAPAGSGPRGARREPGAVRHRRPVRPDTAPARRGRRGGRGRRARAGTARPARRLPPAAGPVAAEARRHLLALLGAGPRTVRSGRRSTRPGS